VPGKAIPLYLVYPADALDHALYRIVERCPPTTNDFLSYEALGKKYNQREFFKGIGVSMHTTRKQSAAIARRFRDVAAVAKLDLRDAPVVWASTGGSGHITVWAPAAILVDRVIQCEEL
jgi:hypothetical protein